MSKPDPMAGDSLEKSIYKWYKKLPEITLPNIDSPDGTFLEVNVSELVKFINAYTTNKIIEARIDQIHKDLGGYSYTMPMKSMRTRNTAFKLYAVKFFNGTIAKRREKQLAQLQEALNHRKDD